MNTIRIYLGEKSFFKSVDFEIKEEDNLNFIYSKESALEIMKKVENNFKCVGVEQTNYSKFFIDLSKKYESELLNSIEKEFL